MIIIGEKLNSSIKDTRLAMEQNNDAYIAELAKKQVEAGADYLDINAAMFLEAEADKLIWALNIILPIAKGRIMLDSTNFNAVASVLQQIEIPDLILNSITLEEKRFQGFLPLIKKYNTGVVALPIDKTGVPSTATGRIAVAKELVSALEDEGIDRSRIYLDALLETAATGDGPKKALETITLLRQELPGIHIICGLSNVSFGLPMREALNLAFLSASVCNGMDSAIMDITNEKNQQAVYAAEVIAGLDEYCLNYIQFCKKG